MRRGRLTRFESTDEGTFGVFSSGPLRLYSGELPWRENRRQRSCIPPGEYRCAMVWSPRFKRKLYLVHPVPERSAILIHGAAWMGDVEKGLRTHLQGCIAFGERLGRLEGQKCLLVSQPAVRRLEEHFGGEPFVLTIEGEPHA